MFGEDGFANGKHHLPVIARQSRPGRDRNRRLPSRPAGLIFGEPKSGSP